MAKYVMSDGRQFTNFQPACEMNKMIQEKYQIKDSHAYRYFLQENAEKVMKDLAHCEPANSECSICPVCKQALDK